MSNNSYIIAAYAVTWIAILGYAARLMLKGARAEAEFARLTGEAEK
jgi:CcmD family protein